MRNILIDGREKMEERRMKKEEGSNLLVKASGRFFSSFFFLLSSFVLLSSSLNAQELKDIKPPVDLPETPWLMIALITLGVLALILGVWYWLRLKPKTAPKVALKTAWDVAYERMDDLRKRDPFGQGRAQEHFIELSAIAREYIESRFNIRAPEMTTEEFLEQVKNASALAPKQKEILKSFLQLCDMVKFAKYGPNAQEAIESFELIKKLVDETKEGIGVRV